MCTQTCCVQARVCECICVCAWNHFDIFFGRSQAHNEPGRKVMLQKILISSYIFIAHEDKNEDQRYLTSLYFKVVFHLNRIKDFLSSEHLIIITRVNFLPH